MSKRRPRGYQVRRVICSCGQEVPRDQLGRHVEREHRGKVKLQTSAGTIDADASEDAYGNVHVHVPSDPVPFQPVVHQLPPDPCPVCAADNVT